MKKLLEERDRQMDLQINAEVHSLLGMTKERFKDTFPILDGHKGYESPFNYTLFITGISQLDLDLQMKIIGGHDNTLGAKINKHGQQPTKKSYVVWTNGGKNTEGTIAEIHKKPPKNTRYGTISEGILLALAYPELIKENSIILPAAFIGFSPISSPENLVYATLGRNFAPSLFKGWYDPNQKASHSLLIKN